MNDNKEMPPLVWGEDNDYGTLEIVLKAFPDYHVRVAIDNDEPYFVKYHGDGEHDGQYVWWLSFKYEDGIDPDGIETDKQPIDPDQITRVVIY